MAVVRAPGLGGLRADLASLQARKVSARANLTRLETLAQRNMASQQELAAARAEATALEAEASAAKQRLQALGLGSQGNVSVFSLRAPMSGFVMERGVVPGQAVLPESDRRHDRQPRPRLVRRPHLRAHARQGAARRRGRGPAQRHPDHPFPGTVEYLAPRSTRRRRPSWPASPSTTGSRSSAWVCSAAHASLWPIPAPSQKPVLAVPRDAVIEVTGKPVVFVRGEGGVFEIHEVVLGAVGAGVVEVLQGLREGEPVVIHGAWSLKSVLAQGHLRRGARALAMNLLSAIVAWSLRNRALVLVATLLFIVVGVRAALQLPIDAVPDVTNVQVQIITAAPALSPVEVEQYISIPVERAMSGLPKTTQVRSVSKYGLSVVTVVFHDGTDIYFARQLINERMREATEAVPAAYGKPEMGPISTGLGEIFQFTVRGENHSLMELEELLDWYIGPQLRTVPGVVETNSFGGENREYQVMLRPERLQALTCPSATSSRRWSSRTPTRAADTSSATRSRSSSGRTASYGAAKTSSASCSARRPRACRSPSPRSARCASGPSSGAAPRRRTARARSSSGSRSC
jgi:hypothetical protein